MTPEQTMLVKSSWEKVLPISDKAAELFYGRLFELDPELKSLFKDCETGAVPALSNAYGLKVIWDDQLKHASDIYIEAGDHEHLIHLRGEDFRHIMEKLPHSVISAGKEFSRWVYE